MSETPNYKPKKKRGRKSIADGAESHARKQHKIYLSDDEWKLISEKSAALSMNRAEFIREVCLGYKPLPPDPEFRKEMLRVRMDLKNHFNFVNAQRWTEEERRKKLAEAEFFCPWTEEIYNKEIKFLDEWIKRY